MDCCHTGHEKHENMQNNHENTQNKTSGGKINRKILLWIIIGILFIAVLFMTFKSANSSAAQATGQAVKTAASAGSGMVGGC
mgnify:FL=1